MSYADALTDFIAAMEIEGVRPIEPIAQRLSTGELIRFRCEGDKTGRQNGWAKLYLDERPAGAFGNYRLGVSRKWRVDRDLSLTADERAALQREWAAAKLRRQEEKEVSEREAASDANEIWGAAGPVSADHAYVQGKQLVTAGLRQSGAALVVPMYDAEGSIRNLQRIFPDGAKRFIRGGRTNGLFFVYGSFNRRGERVCIGEGLSTMSAIHKAAGAPCIVAFSAKNLLAVARLWNAARPDLDYIVCADDDPHLVDHPGIMQNLGRACAEAAAAEIGARVAYPSSEVA